ncbi:MAG: ABC transporter ATP-binding protein [Acidimicrobiia bacterium]|nr:ABC transporter ATP-binding protein [Acidimicrobiia bacterium]
MTTVTPAMSPPDPSTTARLLELKNVDAGYGPFRSLFDVSLAVSPGSVTALLGANGAGKTTVARVATGLVRPTAGEVWFAGNRIDAMKPYEIARLGVVHAPEGRSVFASLSVKENLELSFRRELGRAGAGDALGRAYELFPRLGERSKQVAGTLSGGEQRMLSLARVMVTHPKLLVADELSLGLAPIVVDEVYEHLAAIRGAGTAILLVEQYVGHALAISDAVVVLNHGAVVHRGPATTFDDIAEHLL